jgi:esterase/lipase
VLAIFLKVGKFAIAIALLASAFGVLANPSYSVQLEAKRAQIAVVFLHGVIGDPRDTWSTTADKDGWPGLVARDPALKNVDAYSLGYLTTKISSASNIEEIAVRALQGMRDQGIFRDYNQVVLVAHSMGGLIVKRAINILNAERSADLVKIKAIVFLATPSQGSDLAALATWISSNPQFKDMSPSDFNSYLQSLENDWERTTKRRTEANPFPKVFCAYETLSTGPVKIVPRGKSQLSCDTTPIAFDRNHIGIAKPSGRDDELHVYLRARILDAISPQSVKQQVTVEVIRAEGTTLKTQDHLRSGDSYFIRLKAARPGWFYVFNQDGSDAMGRLFPTPGGGQQQVAQSLLRVPVIETKFITLDNVKGIEKIYVFVADEPDQQLATFAESVTSLPKAQRKAIIKRQIELRGGFFSDDHTLNSPSKGSSGHVKFAGEPVSVVMFEHR